jgi:hypothetical protein
MNGDGHLDVVVPHMAGPEGGEDRRGAITVLLGDGQGRVAPAGPSTPCPLGGLKVGAGDLDGDGHADIAVAAHDSYELILMRGDGTGRLTDWRKVVACDGPKAHVHGLAIGDVNADGKPDLVVGLAEDGAVAVLLGDGRGAFEPMEGSPFGAGRHPYDGLAISDMNVDGVADIVVPDIHGNGVSVLLGAGDGSFRPAAGSPFQVGPRPGFSAAGDLDGDGLRDIAVTHDDDALLVLLWSAPGRLAARSQSISLPERAWGAAIADWNGDGRNDLALGCAGGFVRVYFGGRGSFPAGTTRVETGGQGPWQVAAGDLDSDGRPDLVTGNAEGGSLTVLLAR